jgi:DNA polymerase V
MPSSSDFTGAGPNPSGDGAPASARTGSSDHELVAETVFKAKRGEDLSRPLFLSRIAAGFPSPADDYIETTLDLNEEFITNETATFFLKVSGTSMTEIGIHDGDTIIVDRSIEPTSGDVVVAALDGELTVKRYEVYNGQPVLVPESDNHDPIPIEEGQSFVVWGVVTRSIHDVS